MTDDEILAYYRRKHGNPYTPLSMAKKMRHEDFTSCVSINSIPQQARI